jgi:hypothetical protein
MRKIAGILLLIFTLVQAGPAIASFFSPSVAIFITDEEAGEDKPGSEKKDSKKDFTTFNQQVGGFNKQVSIAVHLTEKVSPAPCIEKVSPPPNFC